jgi:hypothetical protein
MPHQLIARLRPMLHIFRLFPRPLPLSTFLSRLPLPLLPLLRQVAMRNANVPILRPLDLPQQPRKRRASVMSIVTKTPTLTIDTISSSSLHLAFGLCIRDVVSFSVEVRKDLIFAVYECF